jgi:quercetin dioxygenase-like cupin family protein
MLAMLFAVVLSVISGRAASAQGREVMKYSVVFSDSSDITHFREDEILWETQQPTYTRYAILVTPFLDAEKIGFVHLPRGFDSDWHPAPSKRFVMVLRGVGEVEVGDGQRRRFEPGSVLLMTDIKGRGHRTQVLGKEDVLLVWVPVP